MAVLRKAHKDNFTVIDNQVFKSGLSLKARGLLSTMLSLPDNWNFSAKGLSAILPSDGESAIRSAIKELEASGYLTRERIRDDKGKIIDWLWTFSDYPQVENPLVGNQQLDNLQLDNPLVGNQPQLSTKEEITDGERRKGPSTDRCATAPAKAAPEKKRAYGEYGNVKLTDTDLSKLKDEFPDDWQKRIDRLSAYMASTGKGYVNHLATIRRWAHEDAERSRAVGSPASENLAAPSAAPARPTIEAIMEKHGVDYMTANEMLFDGTY